VKLIAPQLVKPYVKRGKNDAADAEALCEAMSRPTMRFVPVKTAEQQAGLMLMGVRDRLVRNRCQLTNAIRSFVAEFGLTAPTGDYHIPSLLTRIWHLDEVYVKINGKMHYLWRAVDHEGEVLESYVTKTRDKAAALRLLRLALKRPGRADAIVTDGLKSYPAAMRELGDEARREVGRHTNNRAENSHLPFRRRERAKQRFRRMKSQQKFASVHGSIYNQERHLVDRQRTFRIRLIPPRCVI
jgi:transposase-like protein